MNHMSRVGASSQWDLVFNRTRLTHTITRGVDTRFVITVDLANLVRRTGCRLDTHLRRTRVFLNIMTDLQSGVWLGFKNSGQGSNDYAKCDVDVIPNLSTRSQNPLSPLARFCQSLLRDCLSRGDSRSTTKRLPRPRSRS